MSSFPADDSPPPSPTSKGKAREEHPTERTPLLSNSPTQSSPDAEDSSRPTLGIPSLRARLTFVFVTSLTFCITTFIVLGLLAYSYAARSANVSPESIRGAVVFQGPDQVDVLNMTASGDIWVSVDARLGVNAGSLIGVNTTPGDGVFVKLWKGIGQWGIRSLDSVSVDLSTIHVQSKHDSSAPLVSIVTQPMNIPLTAGHLPNDNSWLTKFSTVVLIQRTNNTAALADFVRDSWRQNAVGVCVDIQRVAIRGGGLKDNSWRRMIHPVFSDIQQAVRVRIPPVPGIPRPGHQVPLPPVTDIVTLKEFDVSSRATELTINVSATLVDPVPPEYRFTAPAIPIMVSFPPFPNRTTSPLPLAEISVAPIALTHPNITIDVSGKVLPLSADGAAILSTFISRYLSRQPNDISISSPLIPGFVFNAVIPPPIETPRILRNVTIQDMRVKPGSSLYASGTVLARVVLPKGVNIELNISRAFPEVLVFDGEVPEGVAIPNFVPEPMPLPDPLPEGAFGHIRPEDWLNATSVRVEPAEDEGEGQVYLITSKIVDVPLQVLPGRHKELRNFIGKVIFGSDAIAGIWGSTAVSAKIGGLPLSGSGDAVELTGLPFRGSVPIRKKSALVDDLRVYLAENQAEGEGE